MVDKINDEDVSPASIPFNTLEWDPDHIASSCKVENPARVNFEQSSTFRFAKTLGSIGNQGSHTCTIQVFYTNPNYHWVCFGLSSVQDLKMDQGIYYFQGSYMYSSYYPKITHNHTELSNFNGIKCEDKDFLGITVDFDSKEITFLHNYIEVFKTGFSVEGTDYYFVVGMFVGAAEII